MTLCFLQHENEIKIPELVKYGGTVQFKDEFSIKWFYTKLSFVILSTLLFILCFIIYAINYQIKWFFTYYNYLNLIFFIIYLISSLIITIRIYRYIKNTELPNCFKTNQPFRLAADNEEELQDLGRNDQQNGDQDNDNFKYNDITIEQLKSEYLAKFVLFFQYISLIGLWTGSVLFWMHEFEIDILQNSTKSMQFVIIITNAIMPILAMIEFFYSGFRLKYSGFIWSAFIMIIVIIINGIQISTNNLNPNDYDHHLFTELQWKSNIESSIVTVFWSLAILLIINTSFTFLKNICLCKWSIQQRRSQKYPDAQEIGAEVEI